MLAMSSDQLSFPKSKIKILLLEGIHMNAVEQLAREGYTNVRREESALPPDELRAALASVHMVGIRSRTKLTPEVLGQAERLMAVGCFCIGTNQVDLEAAAPELRAIGCFCIGTNQVDLAAAAARAVPVFNAPHSNTRSVAELVIGLTVMLMRDVFAKSLAVHEGRWPKSARGSRELRRRRA